MLYFFIISLIDTFSLTYSLITFSLNSFVYVFLFSVVFFGTTFLGQVIVFYTFNINYFQSILAFYQIDITIKKVYYNCRLKYINLHIFLLHNKNKIDLF